MTPLLVQKERPPVIIASLRIGAFCPHEIVFVSDVAGELMAATEAGLQVVASVRPGNAPLDQRSCHHFRVTSFDQLEISAMLVALSHTGIQMTEDYQEGADHRRNWPGWKLSFRAMLLSREVTRFTASYVAAVRRFACDWIT